MRDQKRGHNGEIEKGVIIERSKGMEIEKEDKRLPITSFIIKAEIVKALQASSNLHRMLHLQNRPQC